MTENQAFARNRPPPPAADDPNMPTAINTQQKAWANLTANPAFATLQRTTGLTDPKTGAQIELVRHKSHYREREIESRTTANQLFLNGARSSVQALKNSAG